MRGLGLAPWTPLLLWARGREGWRPGDLMVDRSFRWSDCGRSVFRGPPRWAWVPRSLLELAARFERIGDGWARKRGALRFSSGGPCERQGRVRQRAG